MKNKKMGVHNNTENSVGQVAQNYHLPYPMPTP